MSPWRIPMAMGLVFKRLRPLVAYLDLLRATGSLPFSLLLLWCGGTVLLLPLFSLLLLLLDFKEDDWLIVLFREPCSVFGSFEGTGPAGEGNKSFSFAAFCLVDLPNQTNALISPQSCSHDGFFSISLSTFKTNLFFPELIKTHDFYKTK